MKTYKPFIIAAFVILLTGFGFWFFNSYGELENPTVKINQDISAIGRYKTINISFMDTKSGLRNSSITITQDDKTQVLSSINYTDLVTKENTVNVTIDAITMKLHDGPAALNVSATDNSLWKNQSTLIRQVNIDMTPPNIFLFTTTNNINPGGACVIVYKTSKPVITSGVKIENHFSQGYPATISDKPCIISYFALPIDIRRSVSNIKVTAQDQAGNESSIALPCLIRSKKFRSDKMVLTESFLQQKMPEFQSQNHLLQGKTSLEIFIYVNGKLREDNDNAILDICRKSQSRQLWEGTFRRSYGLIR